MALLMACGGSGVATTDAECDGVALAVSLEEMASTPRADAHAESLALAMSPGLTAQPELYERVIRDLSLIREADPHVAGIGVHELASHDMSVTVPAYWRQTYEEDRLREWRCRERRYRLEPLSWDMPAPVTWREPATMTLTTDAVLDLDRLALELQELPGVTTAHVHHGVIGDGSTICASLDGSTAHYAFDQAGGDCPSGCTEHFVRHYTTTADGTLDLDGTWESRSEEPVPDWIRRWASCIATL